MGAESVKRGPFPSGMKMRNVFQESNLVYVRHPSHFQEYSGHKYFNINKLDLKDYFQGKTLRCQVLPPGGLPAYYMPLEGDKTLIFESRFESGNLSLASKVSPNEYNLLLQTDINSKGHTQWFYFRVSRTSIGTVRFNILNFVKNSSLYSQGMKILYFSQELNRLTGRSWTRGCLLYTSPSPRDS